MPEEPKKQTANELLYRLIKCINTDDKNGFYKVLESYVATLTSSSNNYYSLKNELKNRPVHLKPLEGMSYDIKKLFSYAENVDTPLFLPSDIQSQFDSIIFEWDNSEEFERYNLPIRNKIMLHGPSGNGKTTFAKKMAFVSGLPFYEINAGQLVDSRLGATGGSIEKIFKEISTKCIIFFDEIDSIALRRQSARNEHEEISRSLNALLVNIEKMNKDVVFICATNRFELIDPAFVRRMDTVLQLPEPALMNKVTYLAMLSDVHNLTTIERTFFHEICDTFNSYSDLKRAFIQTLRNRILEKLKNK